MLCSECLKLPLPFHNRDCLKHKSNSTAMMEHLRSKWRTQNQSICVDVNIQNAWIFYMLFNENTTKFYHHVEKFKMEIFSINSYHLHNFICCFANALKQSLPYTLTSKTDYSNWRRWKKENSSSQENIFP